MPTISIRLNDAQKIELEERSARHDGNVSEYIKYALFGKGYESGQELLSRLDELTDTLTRLAHPRRDESYVEPDSTSRMLIEVLMLLRMALPPDKIRSARAELDRLDIRSWEPAREHYRG